MIVFGCTLGPSSASSESPRYASYQQIGEQVHAPSGWLQFCRDWRSDCPSKDLTPRDIVLNAKSWRDLQVVNGSVNRDIVAVSDEDHYGREEYWAYPEDGKGDCEDIVLLKRRTLMQLGYPIQALLITVVADAKGAGHAVLTVRTDQGEFILDNLKNKVLPARQTGYRFVKRQSQRNPNVWERLGTDSSAPVAAR